MEKTANSRENLRTSGFDARDECVKVPETDLGWILSSWNNGEEGGISEQLIGSLLWEVFNKQC